MPGSGTPHYFSKDDVFANYTIMHFCGRGAYGEVYLAEDISHKTVALKIIPILSGSEVWRMELIGLRHYRQNVENHRALIEVLHVGETDEFFYYTMEAADNMLHGDSDDYVADTLSHRLERGGRLEPDKVLELANTLLDALEYLAEQDLAHRDLKPANIVYVNGQAKLSDIGLISNTGVRSKVIGTLDFLPPEIADGDPVGYGHDLYALGKVLYCALTGLLPENFPEVSPTVPLRAWRQFKDVLLRACSPDPRQRFFTPADFRAALPEAIKPTTWLDEAMENLRTSRKLHPVAWRLSTASAGIVAAAILLGSFLAFNQHHQVRSEHKSRINFIFYTIDMLNDSEIHLQRMATASGNTARAWQLQTIARLASEARAAGNMEATEKYCQLADNLLRRWSGEEFNAIRSRCPADPLPEKTTDLLIWLEAYSDFSASPLAEYLQDTNMLELSETLLQIQTKLLEQWAGPMPGSTWTINGDQDLSFSYIPAGGLPGEPLKSYWLGSSEVTCRVVRDLLPKYKLPLRMRSDDLPATELSWNDRIEVCYKLTEKAKKAGVLPENYIYRLPYADEWNYALHGAGTSAGNFLYEQEKVDNFAWYGANSTYTIHPVRQLSSGTLDLYDMIGNVAESVLPAPLRNSGKMTAGNFGGSFRNRRINAALSDRSDVDLLNNKWSGFRIALAPGDMTYFEKTWYTGQQYIFHQESSAYELLGGPRSRWTGYDMLQWSKLLGGTPAMLGDKDWRKKLFTASQRLRELPSLVGGTWQQNHWQWLDNTPVNSGEWLNPHDENGSAGENKFAYLVWDHGFWRAAEAGDQMPLFILNYKEPRQNLFYQTDSPLILHKFTLTNKDYYLMRAPVDWYTAKRLAEMLGGTLAQPETEKALNRILQELKKDTVRKKHKNICIALGGYHKYSQWYWLNGQRVKSKLPMAQSDIMVSLNERFAAVRNGKLCNAVEFDAFLMEIPKK